MGKLRANSEIISDKSKNPVTTSTYIKHGNQWLDDAVNNAIGTAASKADKTYVDSELTKKANKSDTDAALSSKADKSELSTKADKSALEATNASVSANASNIQGLSTESAALSARMDTFTKLSEGSTTGDAELADGRVGADGKTYDNIGGAIRGQVTDLKSDLNKYTLGYDNNLIDYKTLTPGYIIGFGKHTEPFAYNDYCITEFIPVKSNEYYYLAKTGGFICWYESTDYSTVIADSSNTGNVMRAIMKSPSTAKYAVLSFTYSSRFQNNWTFCEASYYMTTQDVNELPTKYNATNTVPGELVWQGSPAGYAKADSGYSRSGFIRLLKGFKYKCTGRAATTGGYFISFYTDAKYSTYISTAIINKSNLMEEILDIPTNASYAIVSMNTGKESEIEFKEITTSDVVDDLTTETFDSAKTVDGYIVWQGGNTNAGKPIVNADYFYSKFIKVDAFSKYVANGSFGVFVSFYTAADFEAYISTAIVNAKTEADAIVSVPSSAKYAVVSTNKTHKSDLYFHKLDLSSALSQVVTTVLTVGEGKDYKKLTDAVGYAYSKGNCKIIVEPGTYDLAEEYKLNSDDYNDTHGAYIGNNTTLVFKEGANVVCNYDGSNETINSLLSGLNAGTGDFVIENMKIKCKNIRYCVHDERAGDTVAYSHKYINCDMEIDNTENPNWNSRQCIGGGLGEKGYICVTGGYYNSIGVDTTKDGAISWHNGYTGGLSQINIENVCIPESTVRMGYYGPATEKTKVRVCGCKFLVAPILRPENDTSKIENMEIIAYNNEIG